MSTAIATGINYPPRYRNQLLRRWSRILPANNPARSKVLATCSMTLRITLGERLYAGYTSVRIYYPNDADVVGVVMKIPSCLLPRRIPAGRRVRIPERYNQANPSICTSTSGDTEATSS